jgi:transposase
MPQEIKIPKEAIERLLAEGYTVKEVAEKLGHSFSTVRKKMRLYGLKASDIKRHDTCKFCGQPLSGSQRFYCSKICKVKYFTQNTKKYFKGSNDEEISYHADRGRKKKFILLEELGCKCEVCGYNKNLAALCFHHRDEHTKSYGLDSRMFASHSMESLRNEISKCQILCHNCHMELHHPDWDRVCMEEIYKDLSHP